MLSDPGAESMFSGSPAARMKRAGMIVIRARPHRAAPVLLGGFFLEDVVDLLLQDLVLAHLFQFPPRHGPAQTAERGFTLAAFLAWLAFQYDVMCHNTHRPAPFPCRRYQSGWTVKCVSAVPRKGFNR